VTGPAFSFRCTGAEPDRFAAAPTLLLSLTVAETTGALVHAGMLRCQVRVEPARRPYTDAEAEGLVDLFGTRARWGETLTPLNLATVAFSLPQFTGETTVPLPVPCTYDTEVAASRYLTALADGEVPLLLMFSGTVFLAGGSGLQVAQVPWDLEARFRLPVATWRAVMDVLFPNSGWVRLRRDVLDRLSRYRSAGGVPSWEETVTRLLDEAGVPETPVPGPGGATAHDRDGVTDHPAGGGAAGGAA
jgi:hypothetical protein